MLQLLMTRFGRLGSFLISISFLHKFGKTPMHLFGLLGIFCFLIGFFIAGYLTYTKIILSEFNMTDRPLFYLGILCMIIGSQFFAIGFIGELILRYNKSKTHYRVRQEVNL